ncbi:MAG: DNA primase large subunit PriL [Methanomassiliicoccales archaeon]|nr:DNA primase large subunit PriL [Methanomassiliicoccales archaeon]
MDTLHFARFPFVKGAAEYVRSHGVSLQELLTSEAYAPARLRGKQRIFDALNEGEITKCPTAGEQERLVEVLSYPVARMLVSCVGDGFLVRRYALAEAVTMKDRLQQESPEFIVSVADELGVPASIADGIIRTHFSDFLKFTSRMRSKEWKLVNTEVNEGFVFLTKQRFSRVLQQALQEKIEDELPLAVSEDILRVLRPTITDIKSLVETRKQHYKAQDLGKITIVKFPPCMRRLVGIAQAGENMPHTGRFALTAFLHAIGLSQDDILNLFSSSPDFDPSKTRYQIEHITGEISGTEYTPPECSTMRSYGICFEPDALCNSGKMKHPLSYYRIKSMTRRRTPAGTGAAKKDQNA